MLQKTLYLPLGLSGVAIFIGFLFHSHLNDDLSERREIATQLHAL